MKRVTAMLALVALPLAACGGSDEPTAFESADGSFAVLFPAEPSLETDSTEVAGYDLDLAFYIAESDDVAFMVNQFDYAPIFEDAGVEGAASALLNLDDAVDGAMAGVDGTPSVIENVVVEGRDGRFVEFSGVRDGVDFVGAAQVMLDGFEMYQVLAVGDGDIEAMREFVASFDFLIEPDGADE